MYLFLNFVRVDTTAIKHMIGSIFQYSKQTPNLTFKAQTLVVVGILYSRSGNPNKAKVLIAAAALGMHCEILTIFFLKTFSQEFFREAMRLGSSHMFARGECASMCNFSMICFSTYCHLRFLRGLMPLMSSCFSSYV
jgi:hypothetical protein